MFMVALLVFAFGAESFRDYSEVNIIISCLQFLVYILLEPMSSAKDPSAYFADQTIAYIAELAHTVIHEIFIVKKFSFHPKQQKFLMRILFTKSIICSEYTVYGAHVKQTKI